MNIKFYLSIFFLTTLAVESRAQNANTTLSNLTSPTKVNVNLQPDKDNKRNLGSSSKAWKNLYIDTGIYFFGKSFIKVPNALSRNTIVGINAMHDDPGNSYGNTALGYEAMYDAESGGENTAVGALTMAFNINGFSNTAIGYTALNQNIKGSNNTALGAEAMFYDTVGSYNTAIGCVALELNSRGSENVAVGDSAAYYQNTNVYMNTAVGARALLNNITGTANTACGSVALYQNKSTNNSAFGNAALYNNSSGSGNTAVGNSAGSNITTGTGNTFLGVFANSGTAGKGDNMTAIGNGAYVSSSNHVVIGNSSVTSIGGFANWSNLSDGRVKKNIKQNVPGLVFINKLQPITYNLDLDAADKITDRPQIKTEGGKPIQLTTEETTARKAKEEIIYTGFIAQDVEKAAQSLNYDFSGVDKPDNANTLYGLRYSDFVVPLVKAVQELSNMNNEKDSIINSLESRLSRIEKILNASSSNANDAQKINLSSALLQQNNPNPFSNSTTISYSISQQFSSAKIIISDKNGNVLQQINLANNKGLITVDASTLINGAYQYSLIVDGRLIDSKSMIIAK